MKDIQLSCGKIAMVDDCDFERVSKYKWQSRSFKTGTWYAYNNWSGLLMHKIVLSSKKGEQIDHINRNGLDNRRENLRVCSSSQNGINRPHQKNSSSGLKGVHKYNYAGKWAVSIKKDGKSIYLGVFLDKTEAAIVYNKKAKELFGEFAYQNPV